MSTWHRHFTVIMFWVSFFVRNFKAPTEKMDYHLWGDVLLNHESAAFTNYPPGMNIGFMTREHCGTVH